MKAEEDKLELVARALCKAERLDPDQSTAHGGDWPRPNWKSFVSHAHAAIKIISTDYYTHEALDRTNLIMDLIEEALSLHPAIIHNEAWELKVRAAHQELFELYQMIGAEHIK